MTDGRVLDALAAQLGVELGSRRRRAIRRELGALPATRADRPAAPSVAPADVPQPGAGEAVLATWHQLIDLGSLLDGDEHLAGTARPPVVRLGKGTAEALGVADGDPVTVGTDRGALTLPAEITEMPDGVVWLPTNSPGSTVRRTLGATSGAVVDCRPRAVPRARSRQRDTGAPMTLSRAGPDARRLRPRPVVDRPHQDRRRRSSSAAGMTLLGVWFERRVVGADAGAARPQPGRPVRPAADPRRRPEAGRSRKTSCPQAADKVVYFFAPAISAICAFTALVGHPVRADGEHLRAPDAAAGHRRAGGGAGGAGLLVDGRLRHRARRLGVRLDLPAARRPALAAPR